MIEKGNFFDYTERDEKLCENTFLYEGMELRMNSQQLQCFLYVAERLNFTKAAEALFLSVPTVTHHIKSLEEEMGVPLFYRNSRVVKLTEQGEKFYFDAKDIFQRMQDTKKQFQNYAEQETVLFRIGCMTEREFPQIEPILKKMREKYPYVRPKVIVRDFFDLKNLYENQQLELVISTYDLSGQGNFKRITTCQSYAVIPSEHSLAQEKALSVKQIAEESLITLPPKCIPFQKGNKFQEYLALHAQDHIHIVSEGEAESILLAKCGYGVALLPGFQIPSQEDIVSIPIADTKNIEYGFYYRSKEKHILYFMDCYQKEDS